MQTSRYNMDSKFTTDGAGITPQLFPEQVDFSQITEDELRAMVLRSRLTGDSSIQVHTGLQRPEFASLSRPAAQTPHVGAGLLGLASRDHPQPAAAATPAPVLLSPTPQFQTGLFDNYKALSVGAVLGSEPLKNRVMQTSGLDVSIVAGEHTVGSDGGELQPGDSEETVARTQKKREKNRIAQQRFRLRQKQLVVELREELQTKTKEIEDLKEEKTRVQEENKALRGKLLQMGVDVDNVVQSTIHQEAGQPPGVKEKDDVAGIESKEDCAEEQ